MTIDPIGPTHSIGHDSICVPIRLGRRLLDPLVLVSQMLCRPQITRPCVAFKVLCTGSTTTQSAKLAAGRGITDFLVRGSAEELANPEASGVASGLSRR